ncbi:MAG: hypothetical protein IKW26_04480 [Treponema sp.]|nr:hypothetical protein [Treponema sp.]
MTDKTILHTHSSWELLSHEDFSQLLHQVISVLEQEDASYRPASCCGAPGGLVDLVEKQPAVPTMIVPDLHGRGDFLKNILEFTPNLAAYFPQLTAQKALSVKELLEAGFMNLVCVGDGLHSELHRERWLLALEEYEAGNLLGEALTKEMTEGLGLMTLVMKCKLAFPRYFHFLKGNHENIMNHWGKGDRPFKKFAKEGEMSRDFVQHYYGDDILYLYSHFEQLLPLLVQAPRCLISHSEPASYFSRQEVIDALTDSAGQVVHGLTWTRNDESQEGAVASMLQEFLPQYYGEGKTSCLYFGGHRTIGETYRLRQDGLFVQFHNPRRQQVAFVPVHRSFDFDSDFIQLGN